MATKTKKTVEPVERIVGASYRSRHDTRTFVLCSITGDKARFGVVAGNGNGRNFVSMRWDRMVKEGLKLDLLPDGKKPIKAKVERKAPTEPNAARAARKPKKAQAQAA